MTDMAGMRRARTQDGRYVTIGISTPVFEADTLVGYMSYVVNGKGFAVRVFITTK